MEQDINTTDLIMRKMNLPTESLHFVIQGQQPFSFSIESMRDSRREKQDSGAYNMNVNQQKTKAEAMMLVKEI